MIEMNRLKGLLPIDVQETLSKYSAKWAYFHPEYLKAVNEYYRNFTCRLADWPAEVKRTMDEISVPVYLTMSGPNEFTTLGNLRDWDVTRRLSEIHIPTLVIGGRYDQITPKIAETIHSGIPGSKLVIFENSAHVPMWEEQDKYLKVLKEFILS
jgi:proline iminopeptidase